MDVEKKLEQEILSVLEKMNAVKKYKACDYLCLYNQVYIQCTKHRRGVQMHQLAVKLIDGVKKEHEDGKLDREVAAQRLTAISKIFMYLDRFHCERFPADSIQKLCHEALNA